MAHCSPESARRGLTLIELVVVIAVLTTLAALVVPRLDFLKAQADHAASASTAADLATLLQTYRTSTNSYPTLDSLVDTAGAIVNSSANPGGALFPDDTSPALTVETLDGTSGGRWYASLLDGGLRYAYAHTPSASNASSSVSAANAATPVDMVAAAGGSGLKAAVLNGSGVYAPAIISACFPGQTTVPTGTKLIALGIGPNNSMVGNVMVSVPLDLQGDDAAKVYCRYLAIFAIYSNGRPAQLKMVVDHRFKQIQKRIDQYRTTSATGV
ncbi:MAG: prepilin-type N-terminal cleavage/methylation domain-containing protein [Planctomycetaceae bacterium]|nr:prepilin-type N-terminal cleavage/methylation domain-containing protein [Planctomycetaceae bacterium]